MRRRAMKDPATGQDPAPSMGCGYRKLRVSAGADFVRIVEGSLS
jgi:hypothetical protein